MALYTKMEFAVQMSSECCVEAVRSSLKDVPGVRDVYVSVGDEVVLVETELPSSRVQELLETTGRLVVFRGYGGTAQHSHSSPSHHGAAVAILKGAPPSEGVGLVRLVQATPTECIVEATIDRLTPGQHYEVKVHNYGDLSEGCESCGEVYAPAVSDVHVTSPGDHVTRVGALGGMTASESGRGTLRVVSHDLKVWDIIGRSIVIHSDHSRLLCGIIARSAGLFQNTKKLCTCDGVTIWDEARAAATAAKHSTADQ